MSTLRRRLDELRRAKVQAFYKQPVSVRRGSKPDVEAEPVEQVNRPDVSGLTQQITCLKHELEWAGLKYARDTTKLNQTIKALQDEMEGLKEEHQSQLNKLSSEHHTALEIIKRAHTEELALYSENIEKEKEARTSAENELQEFKSKMRTAKLQLPDVDLLKSELRRLQDAYHRLKEQHEREVCELEERIADLVAEIAAQNERNKRRFQLIPDRTYIVKKTTPTNSSTSIGLGASSPNCGSKSDMTKSRPQTATIPDPPSLPQKPKPECTSPKCPKITTPSTSSIKTETLRPKSSSNTRPKSCTARNPASPPKPALTRPKSCWSEGREPRGRARDLEDRRTASSSLSRHKYANVTSKIDTGRSSEIVKYKTVGSSPGGGGTWRTNNPLFRGSRNYVARSNYF